MKRLEGKGVESSDVFFFNRLVGVIAWHGRLFARCLVPTTSSD